MQIHDRVRSIRVLKGFSQENVAEYLGIDTTNYGRLERGGSNITLERLEKIATFLNVELSELLYGAETAKVSPEWLEEIKFLREQLRQKDQQIDRILDLSEAYRKEKEELERKFGQR